MTINVPVVDAELTKVVVALAVLFETFTLVNVLVPTINPERYCVVVPLKVVVPADEIIRPVFEKFPPTKRSVSGNVTVPVITAKLFVVVAGDPNCHDPTALPSVVIPNSKL